ncbi:MAG: hypothetical protein IKQ59_02125 [Prevotella sp.]|nr:hypothetical protein [Prevotella sp.]
MMKKYLMMGASALVMGAMFTACSNDEGVTAEEYYQALYNQAFEKAFGKVSPNQDWGFGPDGSTRANPGTDVYPATHEYEDANGVVIAGANMNHNEWADPDKEFGGWLVPDPLTEGQKLRVQKYFQANPNLAYEDPHYRHFFVQQVYKGATDPGAYSTEIVTAADGSQYTSSNMNHLTVGEANSHINDFNSGTCSTSSVLDNDQHVGGTSHNDQITLMVNVYDTSCFGYHESGSSNQSSASPNHNDKMALVSAATIDAWAANNGNPGEAVVDKWDRSFMGFDLAIKEGEQAYETDANGNVVYATYNQAPESPQYAWDGEKIVQITTGEWETVTVGNEWSTWTENRPVYKDEFKSIFGRGWLTTNENFYIAADKVTLSTQKGSANRAQVSDLDVANFQNCPVIGDVMDGDTYYQSVINLPRIKQLVDDGYLPVNNKSLQEWVKVGVSDGYFSDWIVTLTKAERIGDDIVPGGPTKKSIRIMAEDLSATEASDFDFNDVVFDVDAEYPEGVDAVSQVKITLWAAGGTLPLRLNGDDNLEVHNLLGTTSNTMTNTHAFDRVDKEGKYLAADGKGNWTGTITLAGGLTISKNNFNSDVNTNLRVEVYKNGQWCTLTANQGVAACKIGCKLETPWAVERSNMDKAFESFKSWVNNATPKDWESSRVASELYNNSGMTVWYKDIQQ